MKKPWQIGLVIALVFISTLAMSYFTARAFMGTAKGPHVKVVEETDPQLATAEQAAKNTLDLFLNKVKSGAGQGAVKVRFPVADTAEYIWVDHLEFPGNNELKGTLADQPKLMPGKKQGDEVTFEKADVVDWILKNPNGTIQGDFTGDVLRRESG